MDLGPPGEDPAYGRDVNRARVSDAAAVVLSAAIGVLMVRSSAFPAPGGSWMLVAQVALSVCLFARRRFPVALAWLMVAAAAVIAVAGSGPLTPVTTDSNAMPWLPAAAPFAAYSATAHAGKRWAGLVPAGVLVVIVSHGWDSPPDSPWTLQSLLFIGGPALLGLYVAARRRLLRSLLDRTERAEREQRLLAGRARAEERSRIAAEMHDLVTHRVSLMVLQAGALQVTATDAATRTTAEDLRTTGCQTLEELRDLLRALRFDPEAPVADLARLVAESGVDAALVEDGDPAQPSPVVARTAYRIVQEALTNVRKHAPGARVTVTLRYLPERVRLSVHSTAPAGGPDPRLAASGSGNGLLGLRERVELVDGTLSAGPDGTGGFRVEAELPVTVGGEP
ncbi:two-component system sensor kinase [Actinoplanes friuliensis DSM 7358]|uniref:histidine kinase n=1 Tax=Actinoplanes friuliensis DSM 7358 TaxID=1246995 RepID=U5W5N9_9ACTN|nr:two-component system sensor kinase [Actinoplanes friuliensis DSM 7358]